jgi:UDP-glucose 4-epimerase
VGRYILNELERRGHTVVCLDLHAAPQFGGAEWIEADLAKINGDRIGEVEAICHVGASISTGTYYSDYEACLKSNMVGTARLVKWAIKHKVERFVYTSSAGLYSRPISILPVREDAEIKAPNAYLLSKLFCELLLKSQDVQSVLSIWVLRLASPYGPGQRPGSVLPIFIRNVLSNEPIRIVGDGTRSQDFVCVLDVARAHVQALELSQSPGFNIVNLGAGHEVSLNDLAYEILKAFGAKRNIVIEHVPIEVNELDRFVLDVTRLRNKLGIHPMIISEGLRILAPRMKKSFEVK